MRILAIRGERLASLYEPFEVDFRAPPLAGAGLFAIVGPTGAGKSTVLDALCLALFGATPRSSDRRQGLAVAVGFGAGEEEERLLASDPRQLLSRGSKEGRAEVEFVGQDGAAYRAIWVVRKTRAGAALADVEMSVVRLADDTPLVAKKVTEARELNRRLLGFSFEEFQKAVLLPQGAFAEFLRAAPEARAAILEKVAGGEVYRLLAERAASRAAIERKALEAIEAEAGALRPLDEAERELRRAERDAAAADVTAARDRERQAREASAWHEDDERHSKAVADGERALSAAALAGAAAARRSEAAAAVERALSEERQRAAPEIEEARRTDQALALARQEETEAATRRRKEEDGAALARGEAGKAAADCARLAEERDAAATPDAVELARRDASRAVAERDAAALANEAARARLHDVEEAARVSDERREAANRTLLAAKAMQGFGSHRASLVSGEPCPLCGAIEHPLAGKGALDGPVRDAEEALRGCEAGLEAARRELKGAAEAARLAGNAHSASAKAAEAQASHAVRLEAELARAGRASAEEKLAMAERGRAAAEQRAAAATEAVRGAVARLSAAKDARAALEARRAVLLGGLPVEAVEKGLADRQLAAAATVEAAAGSAAKAASEAATASGRLEERREAATAHRSATPALDRDGAAMALRAAREAVALADHQRARAEGALQEDAKARTELERLGPALASQRAAAALWTRLDDALGGGGAKGYRVFAQGLALETLLTHANHHLAQLAPRYRLARVPSTDMELQVHDQDLGGAARAVVSLSGGETFLVSLALALGLSGLSARTSSVESLFIDEGFGTLDPETLDQAMAVLEGLQATGRTVGVISHVPELHERIGVLVQVHKLGAGRSRVRSVRLDG